MKKKIIKNLVPAVAIIAIIVAGYFYVEVRKFKQDPNLVAQTLAKQEVDSLVAKVSRLALLPKDETPTVATVSDPEALKDQAFFANAVKGDKVLIYAQAKKAFLYSVTMDKIIDVAPLNIGNAKAVTPPPAAKDAATPAKQ